MKRHFVIPGFMLLLHAVAGSSPAAHAQAQANYPNKPIRIIDGFPPGGPTDFLARAIAPHMLERLKQNMVIDNRPGAGGSMAAELTKNARPDGYTLMLVTSGTHAINASLYSKLAYDPIRDFTPIALAANGANVLVVPPQLPVYSVKELIALARAKPGELNFASSGVGTTVHLSGELFNTMAGVKTTHVPHKGAPEALTNVIAGRVQFMVASMASSLQMVSSGRLRALGVTSPRRQPALPDVPAIAEFLPGYEAVVWFGVVGPAGVPQSIVATLNRALVESIQIPEVKLRLTSAGLDPVTGNPEEFAALIRAEVPKWAQVVKASGARAD